MDIFMNRSPQTALKFDLLFADKKADVSFKNEEELIEKLLDGNGIYWELEFDGTEIVKMIPLPMEKVVENLWRQTTDVLYDFNKRLGE